MRTLVLILFCITSLTAAACRAEVEAAKSSQNTRVTQDDFSVPEWLQEPTDVCIADLAPTDEVDNSGYKHRCTDRFDECLVDCERGDGPSCYSAAIDVEEEHNVLTHALFSRACVLGVSSGCTNRGAHSRNEDHALGQRCELSLFRHSCRQDDAWGCFMIGLALLDEENLSDDGVNESTKSFERVCQLATDEDEVTACEGAEYMLGIRDQPPVR